MESIWKLKFVMPNATAFAQVTVNGPYPLAEHLASFNMEFCVKMDRVCDLKKEERVVSKFLLAEKFERHLKRFASYIYRHKEVTKTEIARNCGRGTDSKLRQSICNELVERQIIECKDSKMVPTRNGLPPEWT